MKPEHKDKLAYKFGDLVDKKALLTMLDPTATPIESVSLSFTDTVTAVTCSAAFPTIGRRIKPTHSLLIPLPLEVTPSMLSTSHSAVTATS